MEGSLTQNLVILAHSVRARLTSPCEFSCPLEVNVQRKLAAL